jgi:hypothetical protein
MDYSCHEKQDVRNDRAQRCLSTDTIAFLGFACSEIPWGMSINAVVGRVGCKIVRHTLEY